MTLARLRFWLFGGLGAIMIGASIAAVAWAAYGLGLIGSCSSTGYSNGRPVPTCSGASVVRIIAIFPGVALGLAGLVVAGRRAPRGQRSGLLGLTAWVVGFVVLGTALILSAFDPANDNVGGDRWGWAIPGFLFVPMGLAGLLVAGAQRRRRALRSQLKSRGARGRAVVTSVRDTNVTINNNPRVHLELEVERPGETPLRLEHAMTVSRLAIPRPGDVVEVWYDPDNPSQFTLGPLAPRAAVPPAAATPAAATPAAAPARDALERLRSLHADGVLTDAEFAAASARVQAATP